VATLLVKDFLDQLIRVDRIRVFGPKLWMLDNGGLQADLAMTADGHVIYAECSRIGLKWVGTPTDVGMPGLVPGAFKSWIAFGMSIGKRGRERTERRGHAERVCMTLKIADSLRIINFTGEMPPPADGVMMKVAKHIPHHVGMAVGTVQQLLQQPSSQDRRERAEQAAGFWRAVLDSEQDSPDDPVDQNADGNESKREVKSPLTGEVASQSDATHDDAQRPWTV
jgi:hypothetical protein